MSGVMIDNRGTEDCPFGFVYGDNDTRIVFSRDGLRLAHGWSQPNPEVFKQMVNALKQEPWVDKIKLTLIEN
jgi:hypothetical protein